MAVRKTHAELSHEQRLIVLAAIWETRAPLSFSEVAALKRIYDQLASGRYDPGHPNSYLVHATDDNGAESARLALTRSEWKALEPTLTTWMHTQAFPIKARVLALHTSIESAFADKNVGTQPAGTMTEAPS